MSEAAPRGHNNPPAPTALERAIVFVEHADKWLAERSEINDVDIAEKLQGFWDQLRALRDEIEAVQNEEKDPLRRALDEITARYEKPFADVQLAYRKIGDLLQTWIEKQPKGTQVHGDYSKRAVGLKTYWTARLVEGEDEAETDKLHTALLKHYAWHSFARAEMIAICLKYAKQQAKAEKKADNAPPGILFFPDTRI